MKQALYRNYRPRSFKELVGQDHVTTTLEKALKSGRISHAYLFTGPRGVGKTSAARILAHQANGLSYTGDNVHLDIIEIDAASNRRIDEIRDLRDKVAIAPTSGKYKVYIIDEVHMLTREAFNALLKTLEEPPAHTIFILATTEAHKLPETIISRTQRFEFKPLAGQPMAKHLQKIAKSENIDITPEALSLLAEFGNGSFRDSISFLDQLSAAGSKITEDDVRQVLGLPPDNIVQSIVNQVTNGDSAAVINSLEELKAAGVDAAAGAAAISKYIRQKLVESGIDAPFVALLRQLIDAPASQRPYDFLEVALLEAAAQFSDNKPAPAVKAEPAAGKTAPKAKPTPPTAEKNEPKTQAAVITSQKIDKPAIKKTDFDVSLWPQIVDSSKQKAASLYTALRLAKPEVSNDSLVLKFEFPLHQKKIDQSKNKTLVSDLIEELTGQKVIIDCVVDKSAFKKSAVTGVKATAADTATDSPLHSINNIFGATEVMEA